MDDCGNNCDLGTDQINNQLCSSFVCVQQKNEKEIRLANLFYTSTLQDSLIIKTVIYFSSHLGLPYIITYTVLAKVGSRHTYRHLGVIRDTSLQPYISLAFCRAEDLPYFCSASISSSSTLCFLLSLRSFLQVFHQLRTFHVALAP